MRDVAKLAGVSTATVSHVLNKTRNVEPDTSARVQLAIHELGYEVDGVAQSLRVSGSAVLDSKMGEKPQSNPARRDNSALPLSLWWRAESYS